MSDVTIPITENVEIYIKDDFFKVLILENYSETERNINFSELIKENQIKAVSIREGVLKNILHEFKEVISIMFGESVVFVPEDLYNLQKLHKITISNSHNLNINFSKFPVLEDLEIQWNPNLVFKDADSIKWLHLRKYGLEKIELPKVLHLEFLELTQGKLKSLEGIERNNQMKALDLAYLPKMENYEAIGELENLEVLRIINCAKLKNIDFIKHLKNLRSVCFSNCKEIESLRPLSKLPKLEGIFISDTKVLDNDKKILMQKKNYKVYPYSSVIQRLYKDL